MNYINFAISSENDPTAFTMGRKNNPSLIYDWISQHGAEIKKTVGNSKTTAHANCYLYLVLIQKFPTSRTVGELFFAFRTFSDLEGLVKCLNQWLNALATAEGIGLVEIGVGPRQSKFGTYSGTISYPYDPKQVYMVQACGPHAAWIAKKLYIGYNKTKTVLKRPFQLDACFIPEEPYCTFSASARVLFHSGMFRKQINLASCLAKIFTVSFIVDLEAKVLINGVLISLKEFILMIPWPLVPARDECDRPCMQDKEGNIIRDANGCPKPPERLIMNAHTDRSQGSMTTHQTAFITSKDRLTKAKTVINVLPAFVLLTTKLCPEEWFDATRTFICETTCFGMDDTDGNFNGEITTAADEEAFATVEEDIGMGCPTVEVVGMALLDEPPPTIPHQKPLGKHEQQEHQSIPFPPDPHHQPRAMMQAPSPPTSPPPSSRMARKPLL